MLGFGKKNSTEKASFDVSGQPGLLRKLLLVVDGSEPSIAAAKFAVRLAVEQQSEIFAVYVIDTATMDYLLQMNIFVQQERDDFERDLASTGERYLEFVRTTGNNHGLQIDTRLKSGRFHKEILDEARELGVDAIVLGGWRRTVTRKDNPSVERQHILDQAECPVIVVKSNGK